MAAVYPTVTRAVLKKAELYAGRLDVYATGRRLSIWRDFNS